MCNCHDLPRAICEPHYWSRIALPGTAIFSAWFQAIDTDEFVPDLDYDIHNYCCGYCGQAWYVECAPEEELFPLFAMKLLNGAALPTTNSTVITAEKDFLSVLAHCGFSDVACRQAGCQNFALNGRALCHRHLHVV